MDKVNKAVGMARKHRLNETAKLIQDQAYRIEALEARVAKADALADALEAWENAAAEHMQFQDALEDAFAAYREGSDT